MDNNTKHKVDDKDDFAHYEAEQLSAFIDSECDGLDCGKLYAQADARWVTYHLIGDVMRSSDLAYIPSASFSIKMLEQLDCEPCHQAQASNTTNTSWWQRALNLSPNKSLRKRLYFAIPVAASLALVSFVFINKASNEGELLIHEANTVAQQPSPVQDADTRNIESDRALINDYIRMHQQAAGSLPFMPVNYSPSR